MTESGDSSTRLRPDPSSTHHNLRRRRRRRYLCVTICLFFLLILFAVILTLAFTIFKSRDPKTQLISAKISGISPRVSLPAIHIELNVTLDLDLLVYNPNRASFSHALGHTQLFYNGTQIGDADVAPGRIPSRGSEHVQVTMTVEADRLAAELQSLLGDVLAGEVAFDTYTRMPGRVTFLGFIKLHAVAVSECHVVFGFPDVKLRRQECKQKTKL